MPNPFDPGYYRTPELREMGFAAIGEDVRIAKNCTIIGLENIAIGDHVRIDAFGSLLAASGSIRLGSWIHFCTGVMLGGRGGIEIGDYSCLSSGVRIFSATDDFDGHFMASCNVPAEFTRPLVAPVRIGRHVPVGSNSVILPGVTIGDGASVCALSLVSRDLSAWGVHAGTPARKVHARLRRVLELERALQEEDAAWRAPVAGRG